MCGVSHSKLAQAVCTLLFVCLGIALLLLPGLISPITSMAFTGFPARARASAVTPTLAALATPGDVVINEVAWSGTAVSGTAEWIELLNKTTKTVSLDGWVITSTNGLSLALSGPIKVNGYYLIESNSDNVISDTQADLIIDFGVGLTDSGTSLFLSTAGLVIDTANRDGAIWPGGTGPPTYQSMERVDPYAPDSGANWGSNDGLTRNGQDAGGNLINGTPGQANSTMALSPLTAALTILISEFLYDGITPSSEGDEFVELCNPNQGTVDLSGYKVGDEETNGGGEGMYQLPAGLVLATGGCVVIAKNGSQFQARFGVWPDFEVITSYGDNPAIPNLSKYPTWAGGSWALSNSADEVLLLGPNDEIIDSVAYRNGDYEALGLEPPASAPEPRSLQRVWPVDTNSMPHDFARAEPNPGQPTTPPTPPATAPPPALLPKGMRAYWGDLHAHTTYSDGAGPPHYALAKARAAGLHYYAITDHGWWLSLEEWAKTLTQTSAASAPGEFIALRGVEWSHSAAGHINVFNTNTMLSREDPLFADLPELYDWLAANPQVIAQFNHPDPSYDGTFYDFAFYPAAAQVLFLQEIGNNAREYVTYEPSFAQSNIAGWKVAPTNNSDSHSARWGSGSESRTGIIAPALTETDLLEAMRARRVFATEDSNLALSLRANDDIWMGSILDDPGQITLTIDVIDPDPEPFTLFLYDTNLLLATRPFSVAIAQWGFSVEARPGHFFWAKVIQADGHTAYSAPIWIAGQLEPETIYINEILPAPSQNDWDGNGVADHDDEWLELFNPADRPVGLGGWRLTDESKVGYDIPLGATIPAQGFATFYKAETGFSLNNDGDTVTLSHPNGVVVDTVAYDHSPGYDESWCRLPDGSPDWSDNCGPSPGASNWEQVASGGPLKVAIFEARRLAYDAWVKITGKVTAPPGLLGSRTMYIQDETSGILIYLPRDHHLAFDLGDKVEVVGNLRYFYEETEIVVDERDDIRFLKSGPPLPPLPIVTTSLLEPYEGLLVMLQGQAVRFQGSSRLWIDDGTDPAQVYIRRSTGIRKPFIPLGTPLTVVGIASQYSEGEPSRDDYRLLPRYQSDLVLPAPTPTPSPTPSLDWPAFLPETGSR